MKKAIYIAILLMLNFIYLEAQDTEIPMLEYGDEVRASLPVNGLESEFQFQGAAGDILIIEASINIDDILTLFYPVISLLNERGTPIATSMQDNFELIGILPIELQADGKYTILVTPEEYSFLEEDAPFTLRLLQPQTLKPDNVVKDILTGDFPAYYTVITDDLFTVEISRVKQSLFPVVAVARFNAGSFEVLGLMFGQSVAEGSITIEPNRNMLHFVELSKSTYTDTIIPIDEQVAFEITLLQ